MRGTNSLTIIVGGLPSAAGEPNTRPGMYDLFRPVSFFFLSSLFIFFRSSRTIVYIRTGGRFYPLCSSLRFRGNGLGSWVRSFLHRSKEDLTTRYSVKPFFELLNASTNTSHRYFTPFGINLVLICAGAPCADGKVGSRDLFLVVALSASHPPTLTHSPNPTPPEIFSCNIYVGTCAPFV